MTLYFDENFPQYLTEALRLFKYDVTHVLDDHDPGTDDTELFAALGKSGGIWISHDQGVKRKPHERKAMIDAGIGAFIFTGRAKRNPRQMMVFVMQHIEDILLLASKTKLPFIYGLSDRGKFDRFE